jgi:isoamylase
VKLIAEPWDIGPGGYQVGAFPPGWAEWNDRYRDTVRSYWKGDENKLADFAVRVSGSADLFNRRGRKPWASINLITSHDGFTLNDLVSYNDKHNHSNGEDNRDGHDTNYSWNHGIEGPSDDPSIVAVRQRQKRNLLGTLLLSQGTPMILAGDEFGRTQNGNNNAYCQDNELSWVDWEWDEHGAALIEFTKRMTALRRRYPVLRQSRFLSGEWNEDLGIKDATWLKTSGDEMRHEDWHNRADKCFGILLDGRAQTSGIRQRGSEATLLLITNAHHDVVLFRLPKAAGGRDWRRLIDTNQPEEDDDPDRPVLFKFGHQYQVTGRSLLLFALRQTRSQRQRPPEHSGPPRGPG